MTGSSKFFPGPFDCEIIPDTEHNRNNREDQGPPIGSTAWCCLWCDNDSFIFYITPEDIRCYYCHTVQEF